MSVVIFCGPSLSKQDQAEYPQFKFLPPVRQGELYAAAFKKSAIIGIIDGYFDGQPAVWHKEILWALDAGVTVFGASSIGALRAAETMLFGMRGVGRIFEDYRDGRLTRDDEVALLHGPNETSYIQLSEPMVNIRATVEKALSGNILDVETAEIVLKISKDQFYQERTWKSVVASLLEQTSADTVEKFAAWLPEGKTNQKREDALLLLETIGEFIATEDRAPPVSFAFEWTENWDSAPWRNASAIMSEGDDKEYDNSENILNELRLQGVKYVELREKALLLVLANFELEEHFPNPSRKQIVRAEMAFRTTHGMFQRTDLAKWADKNDIDIEHFKSLMTRKAGLLELAIILDTKLHNHILDEIKLEGTYRALRKRAKKKKRLLNKRKSEIPAKILPPVLVSWYFNTRLETEIPQDLEAYATSIGLLDLNRFYELLAVEYALVLKPESRPHSGK